MSRASIFRDPAVPGLPTGVARFDDNPERILVDSIVAGGTSIEISTGAVLANVTGVLDFTFSSDAFYDPSRLILDAAYSRTQVAAGMTVQPVAAKASNEFTVASYNIERFFNTNSADDLYYVPAGVIGYNGTSSTGILSTGQTFISEAADNTAAAYARRLQKLSLAIRTVVNMPDVVTLEEVENQSVANDIANQINTDAGTPNLYSAFSTDNNTYYSQDGTGISVGFLIKNTVTNLGVTQVWRGRDLHSFNLHESGDVERPSVAGAERGYQARELERLRGNGDRESHEGADRREQHDVHRRPGRRKNCRRRISRNTSRRCRRPASM